MCGVFHNLECAAALIKAVADRDVHAERPIPLEVIVVDFRDSAVYELFAPHVSWFVVRCVVVSLAAKALPCVKGQLIFIT